MRKSDDISIIFLVNSNKKQYNIKYTKKGGSHGKKGIVSIGGIGIHLFC